MRWAIALSAAAWILIGAVVVTVWGPKPPTPAKPVVIATTQADPELERCRLLGEAAKDDLACRQAWSAARAHFFGGGRP